MAEAPASAPEAPPASDSAPASPLPITSLAELDVRMAEIRANPTPSVQEDAAPPAAEPSVSQPAEPVQGDAPEADLESSVDEAKPTGRFAKIRQQLTTAEEQAQRYKQQIDERDQQHGDALRQFVDLVLPDAQFEMLRQKAESGDWEAKQQLDTARTWRRMVAPIADLAHRATKQQFDADLAALRTLDGMDAESHQKLLTAATPGEKLKLMHQLAFKAADSAHRERIAALEAEVQSLKTTRAATGSQPAAGGGRANGTSGVLAGWLGSDGLPTEEAIQRARNGGFRDVGTP